MAEYMTNTEDLSSVANAIRTKTGNSEQIVFPGGFVAAIQSIPVGGKDLVKSEFVSVAALREITGGTSVAEAFDFVTSEFGGIE